MSLMYIYIKHMSVVIYRAVIAFVVVSEQPGGTTAYLLMISKPSNLVKSSLYVTQTLVGDSCMVSNVPDIRLRC